MKAMNNKHQRAVAKAHKLLAKYHDLDNQRNAADGLGDERLYAKLDKQCEHVFNQYLETIEDLPKRELINLEKSIY